VTETVTPPPHPRRERRRFALHELRPHHADVRAVLAKPTTWIVAAWLLVFAALLWRTVPVSGDGTYYYAWLRSVAVDHDVDFRNDLQPFQANPHVAAQLDSGVQTAAGLTPNLFSVGPALLWAPLWLPVHWIRAGDGFTRLELLVPSLATGLYGLAGLLLTYGFVRRVLRGCAAPRADASSALATVAVLFGTSLGYYLAIEASLSHGLGFCAVSLLLYLWSRWRTALLAATREHWWRWLVLGLVVGVAACVRWQLIAVGLVVPGIDAVLALVRNRQHLLAALGNVGLLAAGALLGFAPQLVGWKLLYGAWLTVPQGSGFLDWRSPHLLEVLVSNRHGLLTWTPLAVLALIGLVLALRKSVAVRYALAVLALQVYINGAAVEWWGGDAFGARRIVDAAAVLVLGLALLLTATRRRWLRWSLLVLCALLIVGNVLFVQAYRLDRIPRAEPASLPQAITSMLSVLGWGKP